MDLNSHNLTVFGHNVHFSHKGKFKALNGLDIQVPKGIIYGLLGPSGCGKTTLLRCIVGRLKPKHGSILVYGKIPGEVGFSIPGPGVGYMPQELALHLDISIQETLIYFGRLMHMTAYDINQKIEFLIKLLRIPNKSLLINSLSGGQQRRVSFAAALIHNPPFLILDEPTVGVDPLLRQSIWKHLKTLTETDHTTIIITTHYVEEARLAHMVGLMRNGALLAEEDPEKLIKNNHVQTLEEVFLKLCYKELTNLEDNELSHMESSEYMLNKINGNNDCEMQEVVNGTSSHFGDKKSSKHNSNSSIPSLKNKKIDTEDYYKLDVIYNKSLYTKLFRRKIQRLNTLTLKSFVHLRRNWLLSVFHLFIPIIAIVCACLFIGQNPKNLELSVVNLETAIYAISEKFLKHIDSDVIIQVPYTDLQLAIESVRDGRTWGVLYIGPYFTTSLIDRLLEGSNVNDETIDNGTITLFLDMTNHQIFSTIASAVMEGFQNFSTAMLLAADQSPKLASPPIILGKPIYGGKSSSFTQFIASGLMVSVTNFMALGLTSMSIVLEKKQGLLDRSWIAGVTYTEVIFSKLFSMIFTMILQVVLVLCIVIFIFNTPVEGSLFWVFICVFLSGVNGMAEGLLISSVSNNENEAVMLILGCFTPVFLLCGVLWPVEAMHSYLKYFSYSLPMTLLLKSIRSILARGWSITSTKVWIGPLTCSVWTMGFLIFAVIIFKYRS